VLQLLDTQTETRVSGQFGEDHLPYEYDGDYSTLPHLSEMTAVALDILDDDPEGFFLMVEGGRIDHAGEDNELERNVFETIEFAHAVQVARDWAGNRRDTLILVTADHEAGGLTVLEGEDAQGFPNVSWSTTGHTGVDVPVYAWGTHAERVDGVMDNTDLFRLAVSAVPEPSSPHLQLVALATLGLCVRFTASRSAAAGEAG
jgi:alkaline phosphatase